MTALHELQQAFSAALKNADEEAPISVTGRPGENPAKRFGVYRNNVTVSLVEALISAFPVVHRLVGDDFFRAMARVYVGLHPPRSPLMFAYGENFPDFVSDFPPAASLPYLSDIARIEAAWRRAYHAADEKPLAIEAMAAVEQEKLPGLRLTLHPAVHVVRSRFPAVSIWLDNRGEERTGQRIDMSSAEDGLVTRPALDVEVRRLPSGGAAFIDALQSGATLEAAAGAGADDGRRSGARFELSDHLVGLFQSGAVVSLNLATVVPSGSAEL